MRNFDNERITRGVRHTIPNIIQHEVWKHWERVINPDKDSVVEVSLTPHLFMRKAQRIAIKQIKGVSVVPTNQAVTASLIITYFDGEATMLLYEEAEEVFGHLLAESLADKQNLV